MSPLLLAPVLVLLLVLLLVVRRRQTRAAQEVPAPSPAAALPLLSDPLTDPLTDPGAENVAPELVEPVDAAADLALSVADLASILLGGVRPSTLRAAGRIAGDADAALDLERMFASPRVPHLSFWY